MTKTLDIFDFLPQEVNERIDDMGYELLKANGYNTNGVKTSSRKRNKLKKALLKDKKRLVYFTMIEKETGNILFWFELKKEKEIIAKSQVFCLKQAKGGENGERESKERPSDAPQDNA